MRIVVLKGLVLFFSIVLIGCENTEKKLMKEGGELVVKIEKYKAENGHLPNSLESLG
jgi:hypothetical protein